MIDNKPLGGAFALITFCKLCGNPMEDVERFCSVCGTNQLALMLGRPGPTAGMPVAEVARQAPTTVPEITPQTRTPGASITHVRVSIQAQARLAMLRSLYEMGALTQAEYSEQEKILLKEGLR